LTDDSKSTRLTLPVFFDGPEDIEVPLDFDDFKDAAEDDDA